MFDDAAATRMPLDRHVIGRIREDHIGPIRHQKRLIGCGVQRRAAVEAVLSELPKISRPGDRRSVEHLWKRVGAIVGLFTIPGMKSICAVSKPSAVKS